MSSIHLPKHYFELTRSDVIDVLRNSSPKQSADLGAKLLPFGIVKNNFLEQKLAALPDKAFSPALDFRAVARAVFEVLKPTETLANYAEYYGAMYMWCMGHPPSSERFYHILATILESIHDRCPAIEKRAHTIRIKTTDGPLFCSSGECQTDLVGGHQLVPQSHARYAPGVLSVDIMKPSGAVLYKLIDINFERYWGKKTIEEVNELFTAMQAKVEQRLSRFVS